MKNIIIVLFRSELNYLIKYDRLRTSSDRIIHLSYYEFEKLSEDRQVNFLQNSIPIYEQEHEVLLIEYNRNLEYDNAPLLKFKGIKSIIPLSDIGSRLLSSKLNNDFRIAEPLNPSVYISFTNYRNHILRNDAGTELCVIYELEVPKDDFISDFKAATLFQLNNQRPGKNDSILAHLVDFNRTPSFIPEGNIEAIIKTACVVMQKTGYEIEKTKTSTFYKFVFENKEKLNQISFYQALQDILRSIKQNEITKEPFEKLVNVLSENGKIKDAFSVYSYFYFLKKQMERNEHDISSIRDDVLELKYYEPVIASKVLFILGYTFSIQTISKSLQSFSSTPLLKTTKFLDLDWKTNLLEDSNVSEIIKNKDSSTNINTNFNSEITRYILNETLNPLKVDIVNEPLSAVDLSLEKSTETTDYKNDSEDNKSQGEPELFSNKQDHPITKNDLKPSEEMVNFEIFKNSIGTGKFADNILTALEKRVDIHGKVSKQTVITCLEAIGQYLTKSKKVSWNAQKALKIFDRD